jgi:hypothetical protein
MHSMQNKLFIAIMTIVAMQIATTASAQPKNEIGRYSMHKTDDGFIRLDTETGAVSICRKTDGDWSCRPTPDEASKLRAEIDSLRHRNDELSRQLAARTGQPKRAPDAYGSDNDRSEHKTFRLPSEKEVDKALDYFESILKKFQERLKRLERNAPTDKDKQL